MEHEQFAGQILAAIKEPPADTPPIQFDEKKQNNAGRCMTAIVCHRLSAGGLSPKRVRHTTFEWSDGLLALRNTRITDHHWSTLQLNVAEQLHSEATSRPVAYVLTYWAISDGLLHVWAIPEDVAFTAFAELPSGTDGTYKTVELFPDTHSLKNAPNADLSPYYVKCSLLENEVEKLVEAIKIDHATKASNQGDAQSNDNAEEEADEEAPLLTSATIEFIKELPPHTEDAEWHEANKKRYQQVLREPTRTFVEELRGKYIEQLSQEVAGGKRHLSILKKNDYGKGGYHDHYWFAFYDPNTGSKTKSIQLFFRMLGSEKLWRYGFGMGNYCEDYVTQLRAAIQNNKNAVANYVRQAPDGTVVSVLVGDVEQRLSPNDFASSIESDSGILSTATDNLTSIELFREYPLDTLPEHHDTLVEEVGDYFTWAWPFFEASTTGIWKQEVTGGGGEPGEEEVDEDAPISLDELAEATSLPLSFLDELEQAVLAKQQAILVGPPGTSKTYIARQFARYFVRQRPGRLQGTHHVLYMHANWTYEDFFEGIKPTTSESGSLTFQPKKGFFLDWVEKLKGHDPSSRHVLVLDEINRCDTAAVLGELLQLLEYRGTTVRLLSGRPFMFPRNLFVIGTMNSADRSIGRMDLALRRRFLWLDLYPQAAALQNWLKRTGNNPVGFKASALEDCNEILAKRGIPKDQHIGHALFMVQRSATEEDGAAQDVPLTASHLHRIVRFSVLPYVRELFTTQLGSVDEGLLQQIQSKLLSCVEGQTVQSEAGAADG